MSYFEEVSLSEDLLDLRGNVKTTVAQGEVTHLLEEILSELKIINTYNALTHEILINKNDIE